MDLLQFSAARMAEFSARAPQIVRCHLSETRCLRILLHDVPHNAFRNHVAPGLSSPTDASEQTAIRNPGRRDPQIYGRFDSLRHRNRPNMAPFSDEINNRPMLFALLQMRELQISQFAVP